MTKLKMEKDIENTNQYSNEDQQIANFLGAGEKVVTKYKNYYATNKRLVFYRKGLFSRNLADMSYSHISSLQLKNNSQVGAIILGIVLLFVGYILQSNFTLYVFGLLVIIIGFLWKTGYYELRASGGEKWQIPIGKAIVADQFIKVIRDHLK